MAIAITWNVHRCKRDSDTGGVTGVAARCIASDTRIIDGSEVTHKKDKYVVYDDLVPDPSSPDFIPFESLTEQNILTWIDSLLGSKKQEIEATVENKLNDKFLQVASLGNPWD